MKAIQYLIVLTLFSTVLFSCAKEDDPDNKPNQTCKTCEQMIDDELSRIEVCPGKATYYVDDVYLTELELDGDVTYYVQVHTGAGYTCR